MTLLQNGSTPDYDVYFSMADRLARMSLLRQFAINCSGFSGKNCLAGAALGYDSNIGHSHSELYNYHRSTLSFFDESKRMTYFGAKPFSEYSYRDFDFNLIQAETVEQEQEFWEFYKKLVSQSNSVGGVHSGSLRLGFQSNLYQRVLLSIPRQTWFTCLSVPKLIILSLLISQTPAQGAILECGTYQGGSSIFLGQHLRLLGRKNVLHAFDTFAGIPQARAEDEDTPWTAGAFTDTSLGTVQSYVNKNSLESFVELHPGLINSTVPPFLNSVDEIAFAFLDTDQYISTIACVNAIIPKLKVNGMILIDDAVDPGVAQAIREVHQDNPNIRGFYPINNMYIMYNKTDSKLNTFACCEA